MDLIGLTAILLLRGLATRVFVVVEKGRSVKSEAACTYLKETFIDIAFERRGEADADGLALICVTPCESCECESMERIERPRWV